MLWFQVFVFDFLLVRGRLKFFGCWGDGSAIKTTYLLLSGVPETMLQRGESGCVVAQPPVTPALCTYI